MRILLLSTIAFLSFTSLGQLPKGLAPHERDLMQSHFQNIKVDDRAITTAPTGNIRTMAEWEEIQTLVITWTGQFDNIQSQIVEASQTECEVLIVCDDSTQVKNTLNNYGVAPTNVSFIEGPYNSIWMRDYGANTMYKNDVDSLFLVDWIYNRPRPKDDTIPNLHADFKGIDLYATLDSPEDLVNTGGNFMVDGFGTAFASELILEENEPGNPYNVSVKTEAEIDQIMNDWMGLTRYIKMPILPYDGIHHIDMHMKLLDEETLLVSKYPDGVADGPQIEANLQYVLSNFNSMYGTPYKVVRITVPPSTGGLYPDNGGYYRTYSNNVFVNKTILLPTYREEYDTTGIRTLQEALPGYNIVPIDVDNQGENLISLSGAIHCITHSIGVEDPLLISHQSLEDTYDTQNDYNVVARVQHRSGISGATLYWKTSLAGAYTPVAMTSIGNNEYSADIPAQNAGTRVYYYVEGSSNSGKTQVRPMPAPAGYWDFDVLDVQSINEDETGGLTLMNIYPNPASAITAIPVQLDINQEISIRMLDVSGKTVKEIYQGSAPMGESNYFINAQDYQSGIYFVELTSKRGRSVQKLVIK
jgi:agmatine/peptidylarginine deiminase